MMPDEIPELRQAGKKPAIVRPVPFSLEKLVLYTYPAPDEETDRFVAAIYADRRQSTNSTPE